MLDTHSLDVSIIHSSLLLSLQLILETLETIRKMLHAQFHRGSSTLKIV